MANMTFDEACAAAAARANEQLGDVAEYVKFTAEEVAYYAAHLFHPGRRFVHLRGFFSAMERGTKDLPAATPAVHRASFVCIAGPGHLELANPADRMAAERYAEQRCLAEQNAFARWHKIRRRASAR